MKIIVNISRQVLELFDEAGRLVSSYAVSTALNGPGEEANSNCTPRGRHVIRAKIGAGQPVNTVFKRRRPSGEIYTPALGLRHPDRDWILTRILWQQPMSMGTANPTLASQTTVLTPSVSSSTRAMARLLLK